MDRFRYFIFNQKSVLVLGILQIACAGLCVVCGFMDAISRKYTPLSGTRAPVWGGLVRYGSSHTLFSSYSSSTAACVNFTFIMTLHLLHMSVRHFTVSFKCPEYYNEPQLRDWSCWSLLLFLSVYSDCKSSCTDPGLSGCPGTVRLPKEKLSAGK